MISEKYLQIIKDKIIDFSRNKDQQWFVFGSCLIKDNYGDVDLGVMGEINNQEIANLKEWFEESTLPFKVDIIDFGRVREDFKNNVLNNQILWIKQ